MDGHNDRFRANPYAYCSLVTVNIQTASGDLGLQFNANKAHETAYVDLVPWDKGSRASQVVFSPSMQNRGGKLLAGYYVPYLAFGTITSNGASLQTLAIPKRNPKHPYVFTGGMNGCSLLLLEHTDDAYLAVHYPNSDGREKGYPLLNGAKVVLDVHFDQYGSGSNPNAFNFLHFNDGAWTAIVQSQAQGAPSLKHRRVSMQRLSTKRLTIG